MRLPEGSWEGFLERKNLEFKGMIDCTYWENGGRSFQLKQSLSRRPGIFLVSTISFKIVNTW